MSTDTLRQSIMAMLGDFFALNRNPEHRLSRRSHQLIHKARRDEQMRARTDSAASQSMAAVRVTVSVHIMTMQLLLSQSSTLQTPNRVHIHTGGVTSDDDHDVINVDVSTTTIISNNTDNQNGRIKMSSLLDRVRRHQKSRVVASNKLPTPPTAARPHRDSITSSTSSNTSSAMSFGFSSSSASARRTHDC